jgi:rare lipoprotein A
LGFVVALLGISTASASVASDCFQAATARPATSLSVVAPEMLRPAATDPYCMSAQDALARIRTQASAVATGANGAYVPLTKDDNTPWRFDMSQNGKRMTSAEFDAWMKAKGIRVATGKPGTAAATETAPPANPPVETAK